MSDANLPRLQGLDDSVDDPSDPESAGPEQPPGEIPAAGLMGTGDSTSASDPMPDTSGTTG